jgi:hypothetical protein
MTNATAATVREIMPIRRMALHILACITLAATVAVAAPNAQAATQSQHGTTCDQWGPKAGNYVFRLCVSVLVTDLGNNRYSKRAYATFKATYKNNNVPYATMVKFQPVTLYRNGQFRLRSRGATNTTYSNSTVTWSTDGDSTRPYCWGADATVVARTPYQTYVTLSAYTGTRAVCRT